MKNPFFVCGYSIDVMFSPPFSKTEYPFNLGWVKSFQEQFPTTWTDRTWPNSLWHIVLVGKRFNQTLQVCKHKLSQIWPKQNKWKLCSNTKVLVVPKLIMLQIFNESVPHWEFIYTLKIICCKIFTHFFHKCVKFNWIIYMLKVSDGCPRKSFLEKIWSWQTSRSIDLLLESPIILIDFSCFCFEKENS